VKEEVWHSYFSEGQESRDIDPTRSIVEKLGGGIGAWSQSRGFSASPVCGLKLLSDAVVQKPQPPASPQTGGARRRSCA